MRESNDNPSSNHLQAGVGAGDLEEAVRLSGYPVQRMVAEKLLTDFNVSEEWSYIDRDSGDRRSLDLLARKQIDESEHFSLDVALLVECKRSDLPYVFFKAASPRLPMDFPAVTGLLGRDVTLRAPRLSQDAAVSRFLCLRDLNFVNGHESVANAFARAERKNSALKLSGDVPYRQVVLPLASAFEHFGSEQKRITVPKIPACLTLAICVLDAPLVFVEGNAEAPHLCLRPWIRVIRDEANRDSHGAFRRQEAVDFVHLGFVDAFIADHVLPLAEDYATRAMAVEPLLKAGEASVPDLKDWQFADLAPVS